MKDPGTSEASLEEGISNGSPDSGPVATLQWGISTLQGEPGQVATARFQWADSVGARSQ